MKFSDLPSSVREAAIRGLGDPEESGAPKTLEAVIDHYVSGRLARQLGKTTVTPLVPSERAMTAPGADDHASLGEYPDVPGDDYIK